MNSSTMAAAAPSFDVSRFAALILVVGVHVVLLMAIWTARSEQEPIIEAPTLAFVDLPALPNPPAPAPEPQAMPKPKAEKVPPKLVPRPKPLPKSPVELPRSEAAPVIPQESVEPPAKEVAVPAAKTAPEVPPQPPSQPTVQAGYMSMPRSYPRQSQLLGEEGTVIVSVLVSEEGMPMSVTLVSSSGFERLDEDAKRTVMKWRFNPAKQNGKPVEQSVRVPIKYSLSKAT